MHLLVCMSNANGSTTQDPIGGKKKLKRNIYLVIEWVKTKRKGKRKENSEKEIDLYFLCILHPERNENKGWQQRQK